MTSTPSGTPRRIVELISGTVRCNPSIRRALTRLSSETCLGDAVVRFHNSHKNLDLTELLSAARVEFLRQTLLSLSKRPSPNGHVLVYSTKMSSRQFSYHPIDEAVHKLACEMQIQRYDDSIELETGSYAVAGFCWGCLNAVMAAYPHQLESRSRRILAYYNPDTVAGRRVIAQLKTTFPDSWSDDGSWPGLTDHIGLCNKCFPDECELCDYRREYSISDIKSLRIVPGRPQVYVCRRCEHKSYSHITPPETYPSAAREWLASFDLEAAVN